MKTRDIAAFMRENETPRTRAFGHAVDLEFLILNEMERQGINKTELAERMDISPARLSKLLNTQPNMTLETIARFELALGIDLTFEVKREERLKEVFTIPYEIVDEENPAIDEEEMESAEGKTTTATIEPDCCRDWNGWTRIMSQDEWHEMRMAA